MKKMVFILLLTLWGIDSLNAQQLSNVYITQNGKAAYRIGLNNIYVMLTDGGKITDIKTDTYGTILYNTNKRVEQIGDVKIGFSYQGLVNMIGNTSVLYDYTGRVDRIGNLTFRYNYNGIMAAVGNQTINYNPNNTIDQFDKFKITYNYTGQVQKIDDSKGLILLQLNYDKEK
jgi:hypothetical protein